MYGYPVNTCSIYERNHAAGTKAAKFGHLDVLALLIPISSFIEFELIGRVFATELLLAFSIPFLLYSGKGREISLALPKFFLLLACLWLIGQVITDIVRQTPFNDWIRGWAKITFTMINFVALSMLIERRPQRVFLFSLGLALGGILTYFFNPSDYAAYYPWKFGYGFAITLLMVLLATGFYKRSFFRYFVVFTIIAGIGLVNIIMGYRSLGGVLCLTLFFLVSKSIVANHNSKLRPMGNRKFILLVTIIIVGGWSVFTLYSTLAESGVLGYDALQKYETQRTGAYGVLIGGRTEILSTVIAIKDSPLVGHGSWAKNCLYSDILSEMRRKLGYFQSPDDDDCLIPNHSIFLGAWVESGILGAVFWFWVGITAMRTLLVVFQHNIKLDPLITFYGFLFFWDWAFSPYGATSRFVTTFYFVSFIAALTSITNGKAYSVRDIRYFGNAFIRAAKNTGRS